MLCRVSIYKMDLKYFQELTIPELKDYLRLNGLRLTGKKAELAELAYAHAKNTPSPQIQTA